MYVYQLYDRSKESYSKAIYSQKRRRRRRRGIPAYRRMRPTGVAALPALGEPPLAGGSRAAMGTYHGATRGRAVASRASSRAGFGAVPLWCSNTGPSQQPARPSGFTCQDDHRFTGPVNNNPRLIPLSAAGPVGVVPLRQCSPGSFFCCLASSGVQFHGPVCALKSQCWRYSSRSPIALSRSSLCRARESGE
jgi:hypothetical protein